MSTSSSVWKKLATRRGLRRLAATGAAVTVSAGIGAAATTPDAGWYVTARKPSWDPPPLAYPLVWTPLYADLAATSAAALTALADQGRHDEASALRKALAVNLVLNTGWSVLFWRVRRPWVSTAWCAVLATHSAGLVKRLGDVDPALGAALAPYPLWCGFATALNGEIARLNS